MRAAILDFGTNTFNLLVAEKCEGGFRTLYSGKEGVKLGKGGINNRTIAPDAIERGLKGIANHMKTIESYKVDTIIAYATSAMRNAENGRLFAAMIKEQFGFETHIISGEEEATLIYDGINSSVDLGKETAMILDIGGGSNEFIICKSEGILWKHSFELGMARIVDKFSISNPISAEEITSLENYFEAELALLFKEVKKYKPTMLLGASGSFDTLLALANSRFKLNNTDSTSRLISTEHFHEIYQVLLKSSTEERLAMPGMEPMRVEMMVPASIFINFVYNKCELTSFRQSNYALKEGVMSRLIK